MKNLLIFGVGLIGGSIALESQKKRMFNQVIGVQRDGGTALSSFVSNGMLDKISKNLNDDIKQADLIVIATPVAQVQNILKKIYPSLSSRTIVIDVGSTKSNIMHFAKEELKEKFSQFVGSHPIAGSEKHGPTAAILNLFKNKDIILTPEAETDSSKLEMTVRFWEDLGGIIKTMDPLEHDQIFSTVSHIPHLIAYNMVNLIAQKNNTDTLLEFAASGFKDFSRIAGSSPEVWKDISLANKTAILNDLDLFIKEINKTSNLIKNNDYVALEKYFDVASKIRKNWIKKN
ncbi:prephenate dehydrogenase/arogenate dehydrogenase family protein [Methylophilaceae bacterium]|jgi:prephenate dehydrogenase|nr:prephenate dehydrogenase/arogenate dehydrogenase family protein [Methylophilaceae bacterium]